jgi:plasmid stabilization system protein ParE
MNTDQIKDTLRQIVNHTIKGDNPEAAQKLISDALHAKMQAKLRQAPKPFKPELNTDNA